MCLCGGTDVWLFQKEHHNSYVLLCGVPISYGDITCVLESLVLPLPQVIERQWIQTEWVWKAGEAQLWCFHLPCFSNISVLQPTRLKNMFVCKMFLVYKTSPQGIFLLSYSLPCSFFPACIFRHALTFLIISISPRNPIPLFSFPLWNIYMTGNFAPGSDFCITIRTGFVNAHLIPSTGTSGITGV